MWRLFVSLYLVMALYIIFYDKLEDFLVATIWGDIAATETFLDMSGWLITFEHMAELKDPQEWGAMLDKISRESSFPVSLLNKERQAELYPESVSNFDDRGVFFIDYDEFEVLYSIGLHGDVLHIGPMATSVAAVNVYRWLQIIFFFALAVFIFIWHVLLWRKLVELESMAERFGAGNMDARVSERFRSRVGGLNQSLNKMADKISQLLSQNKQLLHSVSHELRSPISRLRCVIDLVDSDVSTIKKKEYINDMAEDITELENLVDEVLNYSYIESLAHSIQRKRHSVKEILESSIRKWKRETGAEINLRCDDAVYADIDKALIIRAVGNLVTNASRYCHSEVLISVEHNPKLHSLSIHVDDDGPGIAESERENIFEPFARPDSSRARETGGYGLGLAIVNQIVKQHRGTVGISISPIGGARLSIVLPMTDTV